MSGGAVKHQPATTVDLLDGLSDKQLSLTPMCNTCGWRKGGLDSWNGLACKCGHTSATFRALLSGATS
jgi:hypothetical protein